MVLSFLFLSGTILLILQTTLLNILPEWLGRPNLLFLFVVFLGTSLDLYKGLILAILFGLVMDIFSGIVLGLHPTIYLVLVSLLQFLSRHLVINAPGNQIPLVAASYLLTSGSIFIFATILSPGNRLYWDWGSEILQVLILSVVCIPFFTFFNWLTTIFYSKNANHHFRRQKNGNRFRIN